MSPIRRTGLRHLAALAATGAVLVASPAGIAGTALADPPAGCTTADMTGVMSGVSAALAGYLLTHPDVNDFFTGLQGLPKTVVRDRTEDYLDANPTVRSDLEGIRQPSVDFRSRCNLPQRALTLAEL